jgi:signal transduction histidine kinase/CheY-like chemotaxis protein
LSSKATLTQSDMLESELDAASKKVAGNRYPLLVGLCLFLPIYGTDIVMSVVNNLWFEAIAVAIFTVSNIGVSIAMFYNKKNYHFIPINCFLNYLVISAIICLNSFSTGIYFYYLPVVMVYILYASDIRHKIKHRSFFLAIALFGLTILGSFWFASNFAQKNIFTILFVYRLIVTLILSAIILRSFLPTFINKQNLKVRKNYFEALFQTTMDAYIVFNKETKEIIDFNKTTSLLFELPYEQRVKGLFLSQYMMRYLSDKSMNLELIMNDIPGNWQGEGIFRTHNKKEFTGYISSLTFSKDEKEFQILCIRDISKTKEPEKVIEAYKESLESSAKVKTRFLSSVSHELRTPLNGIIGTTNLILEDKTISDKTKEQLKLQLYSSEHMLSIINDILDFSKIDSGKMELNNHKFNLLDALQNLVNSFENQFKNNKIELKFEYEPAIATLNLISDDVKIRQVLNNLISNALKFTIDGSVLLSASITAQKDEEVDVLFKVKDTGIGINKEKQAEIFEGFVQVHAEDLKRRFGGTGLGLTISEKLTNLLGGSITVESEPGQGSCFYFTLTFKKQPQAVAPVLKMDEFVPAIDIRGVRILIVEDNDINVAVLKAFLNKWNIRLMEASNGVQALELLKYHSFDLILMDLEMPEMNGYTATKIIRETNTEVPIIAFTATLLENMDTLVTNDGFNDYILKPFKPGELKKKIEKYAPHRKIQYA